MWICCFHNLYLLLSNLGTVNLSCFQSLSSFSCETQPSTSHFNSIYKESETDTYLKQYYWINVLQSFSPSLDPTPKTMNLLIYRRTPVLITACLHGFICPPKNSPDKTMNRWIYKSLKSTTHWYTLAAHSRSLPSFQLYIIFIEKRISYSIHTKQISKWDKLH